MSKLQVVIPMAGIGSRFLERGYKTPKYMLPCDSENTPMIELATKTLNIPSEMSRVRVFDPPRDSPSDYRPSVVRHPVYCEYFFILNRSQDGIGGIEETLRNICTIHGWNYTISWVESLTEGAASTVYTLKDLLDPTAPLIISNSDQILEGFNCRSFLEQAQIYDGYLLTYKPSGYELVLGAPDPHSFIGLDRMGFVTQVAEKVVLSDHALVGTHWYRTAGLFIESYETMVEKNIRANGEYYVSLTYQVMLEGGYTVGYYDLGRDEHYYSVGTPDAYNRYRGEQREVDREGWS
jgi:dTDP-glucose pyrophosphorylase